MAVTPYTTAMALVAPADVPKWVDAVERERLAAYDLYSDMYWSVPGVFALQQRGSDANPIYMPGPRMIADCLDRYTAKGLKIMVDPAIGTPADRSAAQLMISGLLARERYLSRFAADKLDSLGVKGDMVWKIVAADPALTPPGSRISILPIPPEEYFPIYNPDDIDERWGARQVIYFLDAADSNKAKLRQLRWLKPGTAMNPSQNVLYDELILEGATADWEDPKKAKVLRTITPPTELPGITSIPVYHTRNREQTGNPYGSSDLRGMERIFGAVNQAVSDEELALALEGLGLYVTDAGAPLDAETGKPTVWRIGPGQVVEVPQGSKWERVNGVTSVTAFQDHIKYLESAYRAAGVSDAAMGQVDVTVAESGIALRLRLEPTFAVVEKKDLAISDTQTQMMFDLVNQWLPTYEQTTLAVSVVPVLGDKLPVDRKQVMTELSQAFNDGVISASFYREEMGKLGYVFPATIGTDIIQEKAAMSEALGLMDPFNSRVEEELTATGTEGSGSPSGTPTTQPPA